MTYIVQRQDRFYVVGYDGLDPLTGRERRRWHPVGRDRGGADALAARLDRERTSAGVPVKVVSERLGHAHPGLTTNTYQHLMPGMSSAAADQFAALVTASR